MNLFDTAYARVTARPVSASDADMCADVTVRDCGASAPCAAHA